MRGPRRVTGNLHHGRHSLSGARYWLTLAAIRPTSQLTDPACAAAILAEMRSQEVTGDFVLLCATVMPDHVHILAELGHRLTVGQAIGKLKAMTRAHILAVGARWQRDFFEHRLRPRERATDFARYAYLNPYRARLIPRKASWPYWLARSNTAFDFQMMLDEGIYPPAEWLACSLDALGLQTEYIGETP